MKSRIVPIGNLKCVRLPKPLFAEADLSGEFEIEIQAVGGTIIISRWRSPRAGWREAARRAHERGDDRVGAVGAKKNRPSETSGGWETLTGIRSGAER
ncbi:MAG: hypothetical protein WA854_11770 [Candidatus Binataceae bacterium]